MKDGIYFEIFAVKDGVRYNAKTIDAKEVSGIMANSVMDGLGKVIGFEDSDRITWRLTIMTNRDRLIEIVKNSFMINIGKSCNLAENIVDDIIANQREEKNKWKV